MSLTIHHLQVSQSERIVWLCEELNIPYELKLYTRSPHLSPPEFLALHPIGAAPVITDGDVVLAETEAIVNYIINVYGEGKLAIGPKAGKKAYADYLYWFHFTNGTFQPAVGRCMALHFSGIDASNPTRERYEKKVTQCYDLIESRLSETKAWLAGHELTIADIVMGFSLSTMRKFVGRDYDAYPQIAAYLQRIKGRGAYRRAMSKGDPEMNVEEVMGVKSPEVFEALQKR
ncbi:glutathione S-transferase [Teratosphaeria nubilosa]|uniref:glutathione transferase n=1 Tax=Teratosphaeria nubilosa TaxID=161662 RepID=A0A6G1L388_9PEZI|nr:glutathione S-transferase [Teratosphaeria nubilosa]